MIAFNTPAPVMGEDSGRLLLKVSLNLVDSLYNYKAAPSLSLVLVVVSDPPPPRCKVTVLFIRDTN